MAEELGEEESDGDEAGPMFVTGRLVEAVARQVLANGIGAVAGPVHGDGRVAAVGPVAPAAARVERLYPWLDLQAVQYQHARQPPIRYAARR